MIPWCSKEFAEGLNDCPCLKGELNCLLLVFGLLLGRCNDTFLGQRANPFRKCVVSPFKSGTMCTTVANFIAGDVMSQIAPYFSSYAYQYIFAPKQ